MFDEKRHRVSNSISKITLLIVINIVVFFITGIFGSLQARTPANESVYSYLAVHSYLPTLLSRFWTLATFMFVNTSSLLSFIFGMLWFYWIGQIFEDFVGSKRLLTLYILGGLGGALLFILAYNIFPIYSVSKTIATAAGAPACIMAVMVGTAMIAPDYTVFLFFIGAVKLKWVVVVYVILDLLLTTGTNAGAAFTHIGGAGMGFIYVRQLQSGNDWGEWFGKFFKPKPHLRVVSKNQKNTNTKPRQDEIDRILDKISSSGYDSLSKQEKETLFRASNDDKS